MGRLLLFYVLPLVLAIYCLVDAITGKDEDIRHLRKVWWILLILFFPLIGSIAWLAAGRPARGPARGSAYERPASEFPEYDRPGRAAAVDPEADAEFLRKVRERAEEQRRRAAEQKKREESGEGSP
jgi:phospholipase D-like protein